MIVEKWIERSSALMPSRESATARCAAQRTKGVLILELRSHGGLLSKVRVDLMRSMQARQVRYCTGVEWIAAEAEAEQQGGGVYAVLALVEVWGVWVRWQRAGG